MSLGGYISQMLAVEHPERIASVTLFASEPLGWDGAPLPHISDALMAHFAGLASLDWEDTNAVRGFLLEIERLCASPANTFDAASILERIEGELGRTGSISSAFNHSMVGTRKDWTGAYRKIVQPTLVVHGADDPVLPLANGRAIAESLPGARMLVLEGVGHELPDSIINKFADAIADHCRKA